MTWHGADSTACEVGRALRAEYLGIDARSPAAARVRTEGLWLLQAAAGGLISEPIAPDELSRLWSLLCDGTQRIAESIDEGDRTLVLLERRSTLRAPANVIRGRRREILEAILRGQSQNALSIDLGLSPSTTGAEFKSAMEALELCPRLSSVPVYLTQWLRAIGSSSHGIRRAMAADDSRVVMEFRRPTSNLSKHLTPAEVDVCMLLLHGYTHAQISVARERSQRTTANQIASIFRKLKVSGRQSLIAILVNEAAAAPASSPRS